MDKFAEDLGCDRHRLKRASDQKMKQLIGCDVSGISLFALIND